MVSMCPCPLEDDEKLCRHFLALSELIFRRGGSRSPRVSAPESESSGAEASALEAAPSEELMRESRLGARRGGEKSRSWGSTSSP